MKVKLTYFKNDGKYYSTGEYETQWKEMYQIFEQVKKLAELRKLPGLIEDHSYFHVLIDVPEHDNNHPHLIPIYTVL